MNQTIRVQDSSKYSSGLYGSHRSSSRTGRRAAAYRHRKSHRLLIAAVCLITGLVIGIFMASAASGEASGNYHTVYRTIRVEEGMTLYDIAQEYDTVSSVSTEDYIETVKSINHINDNNVIHSGNYISIPVYVVE